MSSLYSPSYLKQLCEQYGLSPSKQYGQNYLISHKPIAAMIEAAQLTSSDTVFEIGPGFGVLTLAMAPLVQHVYAFEIEKTLASYWEDQQRLYPQVSIIWGNALSTYASVVSERTTPYKVLANLPYQITSRAIRTILAQPMLPSVVVIMVQKEVAERIVAHPPEMSLLSVSVQYYGIPRMVCQVPRGSFWPSPKVDSAVVAIDCTRHVTHSFSDEFFFTVVKAAFAYKRKQAWRCMADVLQRSPQDIKQVLIEVCGNEKIRAEAISLDEWYRIVLALLPNV